MNTARIRKLQRKFMVVASISFFLVMLVMGGVMYFTSLISTRGEINRTLNFIIENDGDIGQSIRNSSEEDSSEEISSAEKDQDDIDLVEHLKRIFGFRDWIFESEEFLYSLRYFAVLYDEEMNVEAIKTSHIAAVEQEEAERYAAIALKQFFRFGSYEAYYYKVADRSDGGTIVVYLESTRQINSTKRLLLTALSLICIGSIITIILVRTLSQWVMKKEIENNEMQNRFVTNASHELKTPLAVIKANTEVEQMLNGENEWNQSTLRQVERMTGLIQNLIRIVKAEEKEDDTPLQKMDVTPIVQETVDTFQPLAAQEGKELTSDIESPAVRWVREADIRQLVSLLLDNAIKYCDEGGKIHLDLTIKGKMMKLEVSNSYAEGESVDYSKFFERFYRNDESHNADHDDNKSGYGIGLSIAENLVNRYKGTIDVSWKEGMIFFNCTFYHTRRGR